MGCVQGKQAFVLDDSVADTMEKYSLTKKEIERLWRLFDRADVEY